MRSTFLTGSRAIGGYTSESDWDFVVLDLDGTAAKVLEAKGFVTPTVDYKDETETPRFTSWKKDRINYIVVRTEAEYDKWKAATDEAGSAQAFTREARIAIFKKHLYPEKPNG